VLSSLLHDAFVHFTNAPARTFIFGNPNEVIDGQGFAFPLGLLFRFYQDALVGLLNDEFHAGLPSPCGPDRLRDGNLALSR